jgi:DNA mismatch repair protein MutS2
MDRLELAAIRAALQRRVRTPLGAANVEALAPFERAEQARARIDAVDQARRLLLRAEEPPVSGAEDVRAALEAGQKGVTLDGQALRACAETMRAGSALRRFLLAHEEAAPALYGIGASLLDLSRQARDVAQSFDPDGQLTDEASPELGPLRQRLRSMHSMIRDKLAEQLSAAEIKPYLQEPYYTIRADRYVLPIKTSYKRAVAGIVHDASASGQTVFIEPAAIVELGNRLKIAQSEVLEEEYRILTSLTQLVVAEAQPLRQAMDAIGLIDLITGEARLGEDLACAPIGPLDEPGFDLLKARHPLLLLQAIDATSGAAAPAVIANDLGLRPGQRVLVLTGPNTGGKTVAMKTVGLLALMVRCGLHLPCDERSKIGWFTRIEAAIGDQQSIASHLSTFAAHMRQLLQILERAGSSSLVLVDEMAADTDPTQGQALAQALLEALADRGAFTIVTTHYERLKVIPFADERFRNAGVGFDPERLRPTYRVSLDVPQSSSGIDIAQAMGLPTPIAARARTLTGEGAQAIESLLKGLELKSQDLERAKQRQEEAFQRLVTSRSQLDQAKLELEREKRRLVEQARGDLLKEVETVRGEVRGIIARLQKVAGSDAVKEAMRLATEAAAQLAKLEADEVAKLAPPPSPEAGDALVGVVIGDWIHVPRLGKDGEVVAIEGKEALVAVGNMRTRVPADSLTRAKTRRPKKSIRAEIESADKARRPADRAPRRGPHAPVNPEPGPALEEIDLRGQSVDESLNRLDAFLDHHYSASTPRVRIVHGHGTGALRVAVREHLERSGYVKSFRPGDEHEGGDGATIVELA